MFLDPMQLGANWATLTLVVVSTLTYYVSWKWSETARARRMADGGQAGSSSLPSPVAVLPRWLPFVGGHTLQLETEKVPILAFSSFTAVFVGPTTHLIGCYLRYFAPPPSVTSRQTCSKPGLVRDAPSMSSLFHYLEWRFHPPSTFGKGCLLRSWVSRLVVVLTALGRGPSYASYAFDASPLT